MGIFLQKRLKNEKKGIFLPLILSKNIHHFIYNSSKILTYATQPI